MGPSLSLASIGVILDDAGRVLLVRQDEDGWIPPGGHLEAGESPQAAVRRELREELGVEIDVGPLIGVYTLRLADVVALRFVFRCDIAAGTPAIQEPEEILELGWFRGGELPAPAGVSTPYAVADALAGRLGVWRELRVETATPAATSARAASASPPARP